MSTDPPRFTFLAPLPPPSQSPNRGGTLRQKMRDKRQYRLEVGVCIFRALQGRWGNPPHFEHAWLDLEFVFARNGRRDADNLISSWRAGQNALVDMGLLKDDSVEELQLRRVGYHKAGPGESLGVIVTLEAR